MRDRLLRIFSPTWQIAWGLTLITLPVTSFPFLSQLTGGTLVAPLALIPLSWLCLTFLPANIFSRKSLLVETKPLVVFVVVAIITSAVTYFLDVPSFKGFTLIKNNLEAFVTLGIGLAFYFTTVITANSSKKMNTTLLFINLGGILLLLWSMMQIIASWLTLGHFPDWMDTIQAFISIADIRGVPSRFRVPGTTLEPSWLAHCLNILFLPIWLGSTATRFSTFRFRIFKLTVEDLLLFTGIIVLIFTYSRIGLLAFSLVLLWFIILGSQSLATRFSTRYFSTKPATGKIIQILLTIVLGSLLILAMGGIAYRLSLEDPRFENFFEVDSTDYLASGRFISLANKLNIAERFVYWDLGWKVFEDHPIFGVGLGNTGMFTMTKISSYAWKLPELMRVLYVETTLLSTHSQ